MQRRGVHFLALSLSLLLVVWQFNVAPALKRTHFSNSQLHTCGDNPGSQPFHGDRDCLEQCPFCQASPEELKFLPLLLDTLLADRSVVPKPSMAPAVAIPPMGLDGRRVRAPPRFDLAKA